LKLYNQKIHGQNRPFYQKSFKSYEEVFKELSK